MDSPIASRVIFEGYGTPNNNKWFGEYNSLDVAKKIMTAFLEPRSDRGWGRDSTIEDFTVLFTDASRKEELLLSMSPPPLQEFHYSHEREVLARVSDPCIVVVDTSEFPYGDYIKWRVRNAFGKLIDNAGHPNQYALSAELYSLRVNTQVARPCKDDTIFLHGRFQGLGICLPTPDGGLVDRIDGFERIGPNKDKVPQLL